jgi:riboflavin kinase / FMN adenylyltransferase
MRLIHTFQDYGSSSGPIVATLGFFDGVHQGHQEVINRVKTVAHQQSGKSVVITFKNHPSTILNHSSPITQLLSLEHKIHLLEKQSIDTLILLEFTNKFSEQTPEDFFKNALPLCPINHFILGHDAVLGKSRTGNRQEVQRLASKLNFDVEYVSELSVDGIGVSSSTIRRYLIEGNLLMVEKLLGRKYSIYGTVLRGLGKGLETGYPTLNLDVIGLALPPLGVYAVKVKWQSKLFSGVANLGIAPTIRSDLTPKLEVHILDYQRNLYQEQVEVIFYQFLRPEIKFTSVDALKQQISHDVEVAKEILKNEV